MVYNQADSRDVWGRKMDEAVEEMAGRSLPKMRSNRGCITYCNLQRRKFAANMGYIPKAPQQVDDKRAN
jgi:hypothetical protein